MEKNNDWLKKLLKEEKEIKMRLSKLIIELAKEMIEHKRWLRQHEVRLGEHCKQISKTK